MRSSRRAVALAAAVTTLVTGVAGLTAPSSSAESPRSDAVERARNAVRAAGAGFGYVAGQELQVRDVILDASGAAHVRFDRRYQGLKILGGDLVVHHGAEGRLRGADRASSAVLRVAGVQPAVSPPTAAATGAAAVAFRVSSSTPELVVYALAGPPRLAWQVLVDGVGAQDEPTGESVIVDARTGSVVDQWATVTEGTGNSLYLGTVSIGTSGSAGAYSLVDAARGNGRTEDGNNGSTSSTTGTLFADADDVWGNGSTSDRQSAAVDAHFGVAATWDYFQNAHGRNGIKNDGRGARSIVHVGTNWVNASWSDACFCMRYGDGDGVDFGPLVSLDVAGHEMAHGVTSATAGLVYRRESGGLNEASSDIFGTLVEFSANDADDPADYHIGERFALGGAEPLRYMDQPSKDGASADCWSKRVGSLNVHYSSGVGNHFFYLLAEGSGTKTIGGVVHSSTTCNGSAVTGIGRDAAGAIWYRALTTYMTSSTTYAGARVATLNAARDLYGSGSAQHNAVAAAWAAVNVR